MNRLLIIFFLIFSTSCNFSHKQNEKSNKTTSLRTIYPTYEEQISKNKGFIVNLDLSLKYDSLISDFNKYNDQEVVYDTLMVFNIKEKDTLINIKEIKFIENDENALCDKYLFKSDTIRGSTCYSYEKHLFKNNQLAKIITMYADCVESSSNGEKNLCFENSLKKWMYVRNFEDVWYEPAIPGMAGRITEQLVYYKEGRVEIAIKKDHFNFGERITLTDTIKFSNIDNEEVIYLENQLRVLK